MIPNHSGYTQVGGKPGKTVDMLALAEKYDMPELAACCEHFIAKTGEGIPYDKLGPISQAACGRIIRALHEQIQHFGLRNGQKLPSVDTMLSWR